MLPPDVAVEISNVTRRAAFHSALKLFVIKYPLFASHHQSGGRLNKKDGLTRYGDYHVKDKTS